MKGEVKCTGVVMRCNLCNYSVCDEEQGPLSERVSNCARQMKDHFCDYGLRWLGI